MSYVDRVYHGLAWMASVRYSPFHMEDPLHKILADVEKNASLEDAATLALVHDLEAILTKAKAGVYHCFHPNGSPTPKMELHKDLLDMDAKMMAGNYDN